MGGCVALVEQDYIRRTLLHERDKPNKPNIELIDLNVRFALDKGYDVILEGILSTKHYGAMLRDLLCSHEGDTYVYYFDISLPETLRRHATKPNSHEFGEPELRAWYNPADYLMVKNERIITEDASFNATVNRIICDVGLQK